MERIRYKGVLRQFMVCSECRGINHNPDLIIDFESKEAYFECKSCKVKNKFISEEELNWVKI